MNAAFSRQMTANRVTLQAGYVPLAKSRDEEPGQEEPAPLADNEVAEEIERPSDAELALAAAETQPALSTPMLRVVRSEERRTWYRLPAYDVYSARVVLCAATHGVPPAA